MTGKAGHLIMAEKQKEGAGGKDQGQGIVPNGTPARIQFLELGYYLLHFFHLSMMPSAMNPSVD